MAKVEESPVNLSEIPRSALTSHLVGLKLAEEAEAAQPETISDADSDLKLPRTLAETHTLLNSVRQQMITSKREDLIKQAKLAKLRLHLFNLGNGPVVKPITEQGQAALAKSSSRHAEEIHLTMLCRGDRIVADKLATDALTISRLQKQIESLKKE